MLEDRELPTVNHGVLGAKWNPMSFDKNQPPNGTRITISLCEHSQRQRNECLGGDVTRGVVMSGDIDAKAAAINEYGKLMLQHKVRPARGVHRGSHPSRRARAFPDVSSRWI